ncbi:MAG: hypothetical protein ACLT98_04555 [Eggerthellaceae bacterium]
MVFSQYSTTDSLCHAVGWQKDGGLWYFLNESGIMRSGWILSMGRGICSMTGRRFLRRHANWLATR